MNTNGLNPAVGLAMGLGGGIMHAQPNANASSSQFQANAAASQMVPLMLQMQPGGGISLVPFQAQTQAQGFGQQSSPQWLGMPSPQTPAMSQSQAQFVQSSSAPGFVPPGQAVATVNDLMALAAAMQQVSQEVPVGSVADDEEVLVKALRTGIARGLSYEQALRGLHNTNRHTETAWKNYFLAHLDRLYPKVLARKEGHPKPESHSGPKPQPLYLTKNEHQPGRSAPSKTIKQEKPPKGAYYGHNHSPSRPHSGPRSERTSDRHKPASSHAQHPPSASMRNTLPHVTRVTSQSLRVGIKKPRIRLKKRVVRSPTPTPEPSAASSSSETESEDRAYASSDGSDPESEYERAAGTKGKGPLNQRVCNKITEDDFRAMARYIYENPRDEPPKGVSFWREFAQRKENAERRSLDAWARAALSHEDKIALYVEEYIRMIEEDEENEEDEEDEDEDEETAPPTQDDQGPMPVTESAQKTPPHVPVEVENAKHAVEEGPLSTVPRKRSSSLGGVDKKGPDEKRLRQETSNIQAARAVVSEPPLEVSSGPVEDSAPVSQKAVTAAPLEAGMARKEKEC